MRALPLLGLSFVLLAAGCPRLSPEIAATTSEPVLPAPDSSAPASPTPVPSAQPIAASASATASAPTGAKAPPPVKSLAEFDSFLGLRRGDRLKDVIAKFGEAPYKRLNGSSSHDTYYYGLVEDTDPDDGPPNAGDDFLFVVTIERPTGWIFNLEAHPGDYSQFGVDDPRLALLGVKRDEILAKFGKPTHQRAGFNTYEYDDTMHVDFVCHEGNGFACNELWVTWFEP